MTTLYLELGKFPEAEQVCRLALENQESISGPTSGPMADTLKELGFLYQSKGRIQEASLLFTRAASILAEKLGSEHPEVKAIHKHVADMRPHPEALVHVIRHDTPPPNKTIGRKKERSYKNK